MRWLKITARRLFDFVNLFLAFVFYCRFVATNDASDNVPKPMPIPVITPKQIIMPDTLLPTSPDSIIPKPIKAPPAVTTHLGPILS